MLQDLDLSPFQRTIWAHHLCTVFRSWPSEVVSVDLACQRALLAAAAEIRAHQKLGTGHREAFWGAPPRPAPPPRGGVNIYDVFSAQ